MKGVIIKNHYCTYLFLEKLASKGEIEERYAQAFRSTLQERMDANYGETFDRETAENAIAVASDNNARIKEMIRALARTD